MRNDAWGDVWKVWLYAAACLCLGAWISPLLYNAGKALAEVSATRTINDPLDWLAGVCREAGFPWFYQAAVILAAVVLFFPWMEWIHARRGVAVAGGGPWRLRLPDGARMALHGQRLEKNPRGLWHAFAGFLLAAGLLLPMGIALVPAGLSTLKMPVGNLLPLAAKSLTTAMFMALVMEVFFRGIVMGIFLRAMRPAAALGMSAGFFALVLSAFPAAGVNVMDPEAGRPGFELLKLLAQRLGDGSVLMESFVPLVALGAVLAYARWRTASLWLPAGLHAGWCFAQSLLTQLGLTAATVDPAATKSFPLHGLLPVAAVLLAGVLANLLITTPAGEDAASS
jgi:membrane protease YdiL (CAAX protease family)